MCIFVVTEDGEHVFMHLFAIHTPSLVKCSFNWFSHFCVGLFVFFLLSFKTSLHTQDSNPLSDICFANIFSQYVACFFILLTENSGEQKNESGKYLSSLIS